MIYCHFNKSILDFHFLTLNCIISHKKEEKNSFSGTLENSGWDRREPRCAKFYSPGNGVLKNSQGPWGTGSLGSPWHPYPCEHRLYSPLVCQTSNPFEIIDFIGPLLHSPLASQFSVGHSIPYKNFHGNKIQVCLSI